MLLNMVENFASSCRLREQGFEIPFFLVQHLSTCVVMMVYFQPIFIKHLVAQLHVRHRLLVLPLRPRRCDLCRSSVIGRPPDPSSLIVLLPHPIPLADVQRARRAHARRMSRGGGGVQGLRRKVPAEGAARGSGSDSGL